MEEITTKMCFLSLINLFTYLLVVNIWATRKRLSLYISATISVSIIISILFRFFCLKNVVRVMLSVCLNCGACSSVCVYVCYVRMELFITSGEE